MNKPYLGKVADRDKKLAHVQPETLRVHSLEEHLQETGRLAGQFASQFGCNDWAEVIGRWHDLGKYRAAFQQMIRRESGCDPDAHLEGQHGKVDHTTPGADHACKTLGQFGQILAYCIAGHHTGLAVWHGNEAHRGLSERLEQEKHLLPETLKADITQDYLEASPPITLRFCIT